MSARYAISTRYDEDTSATNQFCLQRALRAAGVAAFLSFSALGSTGALALDVDADDYSAGALPAGTNLGLLYTQFVNRDADFSNGRWVSNGNLDTQIGILRYAHFVQIGPFIADPQFLLPFGHEQGSAALDGLGHATGVGDLILASTIWVYNHPETGTFLGVTPVLYVPTGTYNAGHSLNLGANRWAGALQVGWVTPVGTKNLALQLVADVTFYGDNTNYGANAKTQSERPLASFQSWLKYAVTPDFDIRAGATYYSGGETLIDGVSNNDKTSTADFKVGFAWNFERTWNIMAIYGRDVYVDNGLREGNRVNLRLLKAF
jgi:hypothetical protein